MHADLHPQADPVTTNNRTTGNVTTDNRSTAGLLRIIPASLWHTELLWVRRPQRMVERSAMVYRRSLMVLLSGFVEPFV